MGEFNEGDDNLGDGEVTCSIKGGAVVQAPSLLERE